MADSRLLKVTHSFVDCIDRGTDLGAVAMFIIHRSSKPGIGSLKRQLQAPLLNRELSLKRFEARILLGCQLQLFMDESVQTRAIALLIEPMVRRNGAYGSSKNCKDEEREDIERRQFHRLICNKAAGDRSAPSTIA
ncbi:hypothetical protein NSU_3007 [Novosphingobium pentaromativorans US6-1]|uniref:Uncharacterized protein n=1 Tax=Novosphingobium pentaromativorans US6-1 TaxID=1088721 RepID=G6EF86_9SPHN|nr:hypothetical protein NSU_3007 [Novosphingobium pentaromativorans US6-1]